MSCRWGRQIRKLSYRGFWKTKYLVVSLGELSSSTCVSLKLYCTEVNSVSLSTTRLCNFMPALFFKSFFVTVKHVITMLVCYINTVLITYQSDVNKIHTFMNELVTVVL